MMVLLKWMFPLLTLVTLASSDFCSDKNCTCTTSNGISETNCMSRDMENFPPASNFTQNLIRLDLSYNKIERLGNLDEIGELKFLNLAYNKINNVSGTAFAKYSYLDSLDLSHNQIHELKSLEGLSGLRTLNLSHNVLRGLPDLLFYDMTELTELRLSGNPLQYIRHSWFKSLSRVSILDLSGTALQTLPDGVFHEMLALEELDLSDNHFEVIPLTELQSAHKLKILKFNGNELEQLKANNFKKLRALEVLELSNMGTLRSIKSGAFAGLKLLKVLKIANNPNLHSVSFGAFEGLYDGLKDEWTLQELSLRQNGLSEIESPSKELCKVSSLDLQGNPWKCDCNMLWITVCNIPGELTSDLKCSGPELIKDKLVRDIGAEDMVCHPDAHLEHQQKVLRVVVVTSGLVGIAFCAIIIVVVVKKRRIMEWWYYRKRGSGAVYYVKAGTNPKDGGDI